MSFKKELNKYRGIIENVIFLFAFSFIMCSQISRDWNYIYSSVKNKGVLKAIIDPFFTHQYYISIISLIILVNVSCIFWEIFSHIFQALKQQKEKSYGFNKYKIIFRSFSTSYKPSFIALLIYELLPKLFLLHMFWIWLPHIQKFQLFTINLRWYSWVYALICWELGTWIFHYTSHRIRILWCLHSPHHAPSELNMTIDWVHFFAEVYYSTLIHLVVSVVLGINPIMFLAIMSIENAWGIFIHISEKTLKNGKMGLLHYFIITPSHHRAHHAKSPLYIDTNFATIIPLWDWLFGTLQPIKEEISPEYGITRDLDVTNFLDLYFGEIFLLYHDVKNARGIKNKLLYIVMPPGWNPNCTSKTAAAMRRDFLNVNPELGTTSKNKLLSIVKPGFKMYKPKTGNNEITNN